MTSGRLSDSGRANRSCRLPSSLQPHMRRFLIAVAVLCMGILCCPIPGHAQERFPIHTIELIVPWGPGGQADVMARKFAPILAPVLGVDIEVVNVPGATGNAGLTKMLMNPADGYTMIVLGSSTIASWESGIGYAKMDDLRVVAFIEETPAMILVRTDSPYKTFREFLDHAKANPESLRVSSWGMGTPEVNLRVLASQGYKVINMPFAKAEQRFAAVLGRRADALYQEPVAVAELIRSGELRPLAVFDAERHPAFKDVPTVRELGLESADLPVFLTIAVSTKTPADRVKILADAMAKAIDSAAWKKNCAAAQNCAKNFTSEQVQEKLQAFRDTVRRWSSPSTR